MATKTLKGPLSLAATPDEAEDYNAQMNDLKGQLVQSPEDFKRDEMLAWSSGLGTGADGSGTGGALGRAAKAQSDFRMKDRELRSQYIPLIMTAVAANRAAGVQQRLIGSMGNTPLADMTLEEVQQREDLGQKGLTEKWKLAKSGVEMKQGWNVMPDGKRVYVPDPSKGFGYDEQGNVMELPGFAQAAGAIAGAQERGKLDAQTDYAMEDVVDPTTGAPGKMAKRRLLQQVGAPGGGAGAPGAPPPGPGAPRTPGVGSGGAVPVRGAFEGSPEKVLADIETLKISNPAAYRQAMTAYTNQMSGNNPEFSGGPAGGAPAAAPGTPGFVPTGQTPMQKTANETVGKGNDIWYANSYTPAMSAGAAATNMLDNLNTARLGLKKIGDGTGWSGEMQKKAAEVLTTFGVKNAAEKATGYQQFQQAAMTQVNSVLNLAKGPQTDQDARRAQETFIGLGKTPQANQFLIDYAQAVAERDKRRADFYRQAYPIAQKQGDLMAVDRSWSKVDKSVWDNPAMRRWKKQLEK